MFARISPKLKLLTIPHTGIVAARLAGVSIAKSSVVVFVDSHVEVGVDWVQPLLARVLESPSTIASPVIDVIDGDTFEYRQSDPVPSKGIITWSLSFAWQPLSREELAVRTSVVAPIKTPAIAGGIFAVDKTVFKAMGAYDEAMRLWGGENIELALRFWTCGGSLEILPCSRVGHAFRGTRINTPDGAAQAEALTRNLNRIAEVWLDDYKPFYYRTNPSALDLSIDDVGSRLTLRAKLECKAFTWYLETVAPDWFVPIPANVVMTGRVMNKHTGMCIDSSSSSLNEMAITLTKCNPSNANQV